MRLTILVVTLLFCLPAVADMGITSYGGCQNLSPADRLDHATTEQAAKRAHREITRRLAAALSDPARFTPDSHQLAASVEGWLLKKEWLGARARHEHDADEGVGYCEFLRHEAGIAYDPLHPQAKESP
jgi:hypothetical protein